MLFILLSIAGCTRESEKSKASPSHPLNVPLAATTILANISSQVSSVSKKSSTVQPSQPIATVTRNVSQIDFNNLGKGVSYIAEIAGTFSMIHDGKVGSLYTSILTPVLSPDGQRIAYQAYVDDRLRMVVDGRDGSVVDALEIPFFSPDSRHVMYQAKFDGQWHFVIDDTIHPGLQTQHNQMQFSADSKKIAYVDSVDEHAKPRLVVTDLTFKHQVIKESTGNMLVSDDKTRITAINEIGGKQRVLELSFAKPDFVKEGALYDAISELAISSDGSSVAYVAEKNGTRVLVFNGKEKPFPDGKLVGTLVIRPDNKGVGFLTSSKNRCYLHQFFYNDSSVEKVYDEVGELVYSKAGINYAYLARKETPGKKGKSIFAVVNGSEGPKFDKVLRPVFSPDGRWLVYRVRHEGKRFIVVSDSNGKVIRQHPDYEMVFEPSFTADGKSVAYGVKDGNKLIWKVEKL